MKHWLAVLTLVAQMLTFITQLHILVFVWSNIWDSKLLRFWVQDKTEEYEKAIAAKPWYVKYAEFLLKFI